MCPAALQQVRDTFHVGGMSADACVVLLRELCVCMCVVFVIWPPFVVSQVVLFAWLLHSLLTRRGRHVRAAPLLGQVRCCPAVDASGCKQEMRDTCIRVVVGH